MKQGCTQALFGSIAAKGGCEPGWPASMLATYMSK